MNCPRMCNRLTMLAAAAALCCVPSFAQMAPGGGAGGGGAAAQAGTRPGAATQGTMEQQMNGQNGNMQNGAGQSGMDKSFVKKALQGSMAEVQTGQMIVSKTDNDQVKQFAQRMVDDHTKLIDQAKPVAQQLGITVPSGPDKKEQEMMNKLQSKSGEALNKAYMKDMVKDHEKDLKEFKSAESNAKNPEVKQLAQQGEPIIQSHLDEAKKVASSIGAMGGSKHGNSDGNPRTSTAPDSSGNGSGSPQ
jgi:putative membrane protein